MNKSQIKLPVLTQLDLDHIKATVGGKCFYMCVRYAKGFGILTIPAAIAYCISERII